MEREGTKATTAKRKESEMSVFSKAYLVLYNGVQTAGWGYLLFNTVKFLIEKQTVVGLWPECKTTVAIFQTLACLEVVHCMIGIVPSSALVTFMQVFSRVFMVWAILIPVKEAQDAPSLAVTFIAWGITEVVRYSYYATNLLGCSPGFLTWCRYSLFLGLYPMGVAGEMGNILYALNPIWRRRLFNIALPNKFNISFNFYYACIILMLTYVPVFPELFNHMRRQRKKILGGGSENKPEKKST
ncbi:hypothetical protein JTE90_006660 [Oedothorax gibbosus]|uniref:Very-long-chain (3R)-3-hydroxyacyl-CoA dehydratase n=1 Tax=Oedothorax gibbosus TaxID=931172 RepID=A0AAV6V1Q4_9ARAC|nr:hypothetical protein JTE90_006660 [Oedothorax gibbosus]